MNIRGVGASGLFEGVTRLSCGQYMFYVCLQFENVYGVFVFFCFFREGLVSVEGGSDFGVASQYDFTRQSAVCYFTRNFGGGQYDLYCIIYGMRTRGPDFFTINVCRTLGMLSIAFFSF